MAQQSAPHRDIDMVIAAIRAALPEIRVRQHYKIHPADDDGIWWFSLPSTSEIHVEGAYGMCPFLIETDEYYSHNARETATIEATVQTVVDYLQAQR